MNQNDHNHVFYTKEDFTEEEIARDNILAVVVIEFGAKICKRCGYEEETES